MSDFDGTVVSRDELLGLIRGVEAEAARQMLLAGAGCVGPDPDPKRFARWFADTDDQAEPDEFPAVAQGERLCAHLVGWLGARHPRSHPGRLAAAATLLTDWATGCRPADWFGLYRRQVHPVEVFADAERRHDFEHHVGAVALLCLGARFEDDPGELNVLEPLIMSQTTPDFSAGDVARRALYVVESTVFAPWTNLQWLADELSGERLRQHHAEIHGRLEAPEAVEAHHTAVLEGRWRPEADGVHVESPFGYLQRWLQDRPDGGRDIEAVIRECHERYEALRKTHILPPFGRSKLEAAIGAEYGLTRDEVLLICDGSSVEGQPPESRQDAPQSFSRASAVQGPVNVERRVASQPGSGPGGAVGSAGSRRCPERCHQPAGPCVGRVSRKEAPS